MNIFIIEVVRTASNQTRYKISFNQIRKHEQSYKSRKSNRISISLEISEAKLWNFRLPHYPPSPSIEARGEFFPYYHWFELEW